MSDLPARLPHAVMDAPSRRLKAVKIEMLLGLEPRQMPIRMLEIGCGIGGIAHYFGTRPQLPCEVDGVDVVDLRQIRDGYRFTRVAGTDLPFPDAAFDVVISNHVIEHVGLKAEQSAHLAEIRRVMKPDGKGYLAVPNRWQIVEPHYRLAFLSWIPRSLRTPYLKLMRKGRFYDCEPLTVGEIESLLQGAGFESENCSARAARLMFELELPHALFTKLIRGVPESALHSLRRCIPTLIYLFHRAR